MIRGRPDTGVNEEGLGSSCETKWIFAKASGRLILIGISAVSQHDTCCIGMYLAWARTADLWK
jgi:hypothetical protein